MSYTVKEVQSFRRYTYYKRNGKRFRAFIWKMINKYYHKKEMQ